MTNKYIYSKVYNHRTRGNHQLVSTDLLEHEKYWNKSVAYPGLRCS